MQKQETLMPNPCPSQPLETDQSQTHFSSCIRNLHWACWMNLEPHKMVILPAIALQPKLYIKRLPGYAKGETSGPFMRSDVLFQVISPPPIYWTNLEPQMWLFVQLSHSSHHELRCKFGGVHFCRYGAKQRRPDTTSLSTRIIVGVSNQWARAPGVLASWSRM